MKEKEKKENIPDGSPDVTLVRFYPMERVIVAGDFNARSTSWRDTITNDRGTLLERWLDSMGLVVANNSSRPTCERDQGKSIVDLTLVSGRMVRDGFTWRLMSDLVSFSDHRYMRWQFGRFEPRKFNTLVRKGWNPDKVDPDKFMDEYLRCADVLCDRTSLANDFSHSLTRLLSRVCDLSMPRSRQVHIRRAYWWNEEIAELRRLCIQTRRKLTRARRRKDRNPQQYEDFRLQYSQRSRNMRNAISRSQKLA
ncbi:uncharacterized protein LOC105432796 [Pogonomyrmex barbatus]|uniref:Uncharacterized protein LOC105432796 n=1 Tax=Pogonomyrmex barbatus TaxID=144034 RepID=A0A6I9X0K2_9HYME|nr:uncharacterized protein LOC105432796 [Pogonomyrmex barbatus]